jgi:Divergent InlB B-repeat domain
MTSGVRRGSAVRSLVLAAVAGLLCLACFTSQASASPGAYNVLFVYGIDGCPSATLQNQLAAEPGIASIDTFDASTGTPTDALLDQYDMVVAVSDCDAYEDGEALGNNLADYADQGGVVVEYAYSMESTAGYELAGRWLTGGYSPYLPGTNTNNHVTLGTFDSSSPLMAGVSSLADDDDTSPMLAPGATEVALWNTGQEAVAYKGQAVAINAAIDSGATFSGDYAQLTLNAVTWLGRHYLTVTNTGSGSGTVTSSTGAINCGGTCAAAINYGAAVTLTASPASGSTFAGWSGAGCSGTGTCTVTMNAAQAVTAAFNAIAQPQPQLLPQPTVQISGASETHKRFRVSHSPELAQISKKLAPIGTTFKFTLSGAATVRLDFTQPGAGRKVGGKCVAPTKHNRHNAKCTLLAGSRTFSGHAGTNTVAFKGWLSHSKKLKPGHYTLVISAITTGVGTTTTKLNFTVVK